VGDVGRLDDPRALKARLDAAEPVEQALAVAEQDRSEVDQQLVE
jgi:hypothetical protein